MRFFYKLVLGIILFTPFVVAFTIDNSVVYKEWETEPIFQTPESVVYDSLRSCLYVSNFNDQDGFRKPNDTIYNECISKVNINGEVLEFNWIDNLLGPTGMAIYKNDLYVVERSGLAIINIDEQRIKQRIPIPEAKFLNDIAIDSLGTIYISDSFKNCIFKSNGDAFNVWYTDTLLNTSNGLLIDANHLLVGNRGDVNLISISLADKRVEVMAKNISLNVDGIKKVGDNYILSWRSELFILQPENKKSVLMLSDNKKDFYADFEFIKERNLIVVPTLLSNKIIALTIKK